ncbi:MAG: hypothetical protein ACLUA4_01595 [Bifidobacterium sp.]
MYGKRFHMRRAFQLTIENGGRVVLGDDVFFIDFCALHARKSITIGDGTIFGENVRIYDHNHRFADPTTPIKDQAIQRGCGLCRETLLDWLQCDDS